MNTKNIAYLAMILLIDYQINSQAITDVTKPKGFAAGFHNPFKEIKQIQKNEKLIHQLTMAQQNLAIAQENVDHLLNSTTITNKGHQIIFINFFNKDKKINKNKIELKPGAFMYTPKNTDRFKVVTEINVPLIEKSGININNTYTITKFGNTWKVRAHNRNQQPKSKA